MNNGNPSHVGRRRGRTGSEGGSPSGNHRAGARGSSYSGRRRAASSPSLAVPLPGGLPDLELGRMHLAVAGAVGLVVAVGVAIVLGSLPEDAAGAGEEDAALLYADGQALPADFADAHPSLVARIHAELEARYGLGADRLYDEATRPDGLRVVLTLDQALQEAAEETSGEAGVVAVEPGTGAVRCYYGAEAETGADQLGPEAPHPPSSVFDMVTAATALEAGASVESRWRDGEADVTLVEAVRESRTAAMDAVAEEYGVADVLETAGGMGLTAIADDEGVLRDVAAGDFDGLEAAGFGSYPVSVIDMAGVYATVAADGVHAETHFIERVVDGDGRALEAEQGIRTDQAIADTTARDLQFTALGEDRAIEDRDFFGVAADFHGETTQSWFVGAIPQLSVAAWANGSAAEDGGMPLWRNVIDTAIEVNDYEAEELPGASGGGDPSGDATGDDDRTDPDGEYCRADPGTEGCAESDSASESPSASEPTTEEEEEEESSEAPEPDPPASSEPEPDPPASSSEEEPTTDDCGWPWC